MAKKRRGRPGGSEQPDSGRLTVVVCRGGDCGSRRKHPDTDHQAQLSALRELAGADARVLVSKCLDACEHSNVVVVTPGAEGLDQAGTPVWIGAVNDEDATADTIRWVREGGPGVSEPPVLVELNRFVPTRASRRTLDSQGLR